MPIHWHDNHSSVTDAHSHANWFAALTTGFRRRCPRCRQAGIFAGYLKLRSECPHCRIEFSCYPTDDAPPYFTILAVGHIVVPFVVVVEQLLSPPLWVQFAIWPSVTVALSLLLLPRIKGAVLGVAMALGVTQRAAEDTPDN
jgi:uncharacterized protein (DUF983 family)